ncbi:MAG: hypothetical protein IJ997_00210 [Mycoplasmataceae bacterium]|nr:hypothetical protein [Mycoplasmataceae bacterium]
MSEYIIYTSENGIKKFTGDLRIFIARQDIGDSAWNKIYTNLLTSRGTTSIVTTSLPAYEYVKIANIFTYNNQNYYFRYTTILTTLSFITSDYENISDNDNITFTVTITYGDIDNSTKDFNYTYPLKKLYLQTIQFFRTISTSTAWAKKIDLSIRSTFPLTLRAPSRTSQVETTYIYLINL